MFCARRLWAELEHNQAVPHQRQVRVHVPQRDSDGVLGFAIVDIVADTVWTWQLLSSTRPWQLGSSSCKGNCFDSTAQLNCMCPAFNSTL